MGLDLDYIAGQTPIEEEEKDGLLIKSITTRNDLNEFEQLNIENAVEWTISKKFTYDQILTEQFVKELHIRMFSNVWRWAGSFRKSNKNIGVDWTQISIELRQLLDDCAYWINNKTFSEDEIAVRFSHRIVSIHCFPNGNGRHSRLMADIIISHIFDKPVFTWGSSDLVKAGDSRKHYIKAIHSADQGDIKNLVYFART